MYCYNVEYQATYTSKISTVTIVATCYSTCYSSLIPQSTQMESEAIVAVGMATLE